MFGWLFGKKETKNEAAAADEAFDTGKEEALGRVLGPHDDQVLHAIIPFAIGGTLDLYPFSSCIPGTVYVTQELIGRTKADRPKRGTDGYFELAMCRKMPASEDSEDGIGLVSQMLNPVARYSFMAQLGPMQTAELPTEKDDQTQPVFFYNFKPKGAPFSFAGEDFCLLLCVTIFHFELAFARKSNVEALVKLLQQAGEFPYSTLERDPVV